MICYHGLPLTPVSAMLRALRGRHAMVSFERPDQLEEAAEVCQSIVLDNGAFSAWQSGATYDFAGYLDWARRWLKHPSVEWCVIPDVIDGTEEQNDELLFQFDRELRAPVSRTVPVWHYHESLERLDKLARTYPRIALGSSGQYRTPGTEAWWQRTAEIMELICDADGHPRVQLHGLRMLDPVLFSHIPLASADSCNVARNVGIDAKWNGTYAPSSKLTHAIILIDRIEAHAGARRWCHQSSGVQQNMELLG